jgi:hypothetical protein
MTGNKISIKVEKVPDKEPLVEEVYLAKKKKYIPEINKICKLHRNTTRTIYIANLECPKIIIYHIGQYKYYSEEEKCIKYITERIPDVMGKRRHDNSTILKSVQPVLTDDMTIQAAAGQARKLLNLKTVPSTIWQWSEIIEIDEEEYAKMKKKL